MSNTDSYKEELLTLGYPSSRVDKAFEIYNQDHNTKSTLDRDMILDILLYSHDDVDAEDILKKQEYSRQCLVHGFIRQFEVDRLQIPVVINQMCLPFYGSTFINSTAMSLDDVLNLSVGDRIDHRDFAGLFASATVLQKKGSNIYLHYDDWSSKWDRWSDASTELFRFAKHESVSKREGHRMPTLEEGDYVDINPIHTRPKYKHRHSGWKHAEIKQICDGQIKVCYKVHHGKPNKSYLYWVHLDNVDEVAPFTSKAGSVHFDGVHCESLDSFHDDEDIYLESTTKLKLTEIFGTDEHALYCCLAKELYHSSSRKHVQCVKRQCSEWIENHEDAMNRAKSMAKYMGCGGRGIDNELHLTLMVLADALKVRIKVYTYDDHISPNHIELVTLWADYRGSPLRQEDECRTICLAKLRNAFGILHSEETEEEEEDEDEDEEQRDELDDALRREETTSYKSQISRKRCLSSEMSGDEDRDCKRQRTAETETAVVRDRW